MARRPVVGGGDAGRAPGPVTVGRAGVLGDHFATLWNPRRRRPVWREALTQIVLPIGLGVIAWRFDWRVTDVSGVVGGASLLSGFLFTVAVFVFQLRLNTTANPRVQQKVLLPELIDQLFANVLWAVVVSFVVTAFVLVVTAAPPVDKHGDAVPFPLWPTIALIVLGTHLFAVVWMCVRRLRAAYREMRS